MSTEQDKQQSKEAISMIEGLLQEKFRNKSEFNSYYDKDGAVTIKSLANSDDSTVVVHTYNPSEVLWWVDRKTYQDEYDDWENKSIGTYYQDILEFFVETDQLDAIRGLVEAVRMRRMVPFVGAGISKDYNKEYLLWGQALTKIGKKLALSSEVEKILGQGNFLEAAQLLFDKDSIQFINFIQTRFSTKQADNNDAKAVSLLPEISHGCVVTTNLDDVLEQVFSERNMHFIGYMHGTQAGGSFVSNLTRGKRCILKLHGHANDQHTHIFTEGQYNCAYGNPVNFSEDLPKTLRQIYISQTLLFLGCSMTKDKTLDLFQNVCSDNHFIVPQHFALLEQPKLADITSKTESRLLQLNIQPIWYPNEHHENVLRFLELIRDASSGKVTI